MLEVRTVAPEDDAGRRRWVRLERELLAGEPHFVAELDDDLDRWARGTGPLSQGFERALFEAGDDGRAVARCAALTIDRWQRHHGEPAGFVGEFTVAPGHEQAAAEMLDRAEAWLGQRGVTRVIAGYNGFLSGLALRVDAFDEDAPFPWRWHPAHYAAALKSAGYEPAYPWWSYAIDLTDEAGRAKRARWIDEARCTVRPLDKRRWADEMALVTEMFNRTFVDEWEFYPLTVDEVRELYDSFKPVIDPRANVFAEIDGEAVGFCLTTRDLTPLLRRAGGRMGLVGQLRFALGARRLKQADLYVIGVDPAHRGKRIGQAMAATVFRYYERRGVERVGYDLVNDANLGSRALAESLGGTGRLLYSQFDKRLD